MHIITRNVKDYKESDLSIQSPKEFLAILDMEGRL